TDARTSTTYTSDSTASSGIGASQSGQSDKYGRSGRLGRSGVSGENGVSGEDGTRSRSGVSGQYGRSGAATTEGAVVAGVYEDTPAAEAGLAAGDTITAIGSTPITDGNSLSEAISDHEPGDRVSLTWTDTTGDNHTAEVTLTQGPAA